MSMQFAAPAAGGDGFRPADAVGHLLAIDVAGHETGIPTSFGDKDAIRCTVHDITSGDTSEDTLIFSGTLVGALKPRVGLMVLATLGQGVAKAGQSAPYVLTDASNDPAAAAAATAHLERWRSGKFAAPAAPAAPTAPAPAAHDFANMTPEQLAALAALAAQQR
jgi:hypothetical protein